MGRKKSGRSEPRSESRLKSTPESGSQPFDLRPAGLDPEPARAVQPAEIAERKARLRTLDAAAAAVKPVRERRPEAGTLREHRPNLKPEEDRAMRLTDVSLGPAQMTELQERRVVARPLGWNVPGARIRINPDPRA